MPPLLSPTLHRPLDSPPRGALETYLLEEEFFVATTNRPFVTFDNVDKYVPWLDDLRFIMNL